MAHSLRSTGAAGSNRAAASATRIAAGDDLAAVTAWLARYADSEVTIETYRREVERLLLWAVLQLGKPLSSLTHEDLLAYERFLADPQPARAREGAHHALSEPRPVGGRQGRRHSDAG